MRLIYCMSGAYEAALEFAALSGITVRSEADYPVFFSSPARAEALRRGELEVHALTGVIGDVDTEFDDDFFTVVDASGTEEEFECKPSTNDYKVGSEVIVRYTLTPFSAQGPLAGQFAKNVMEIWVA